MPPRREDSRRSVLCGKRVLYPKRSRLLTVRRELNTMSPTPTSADPLVPPETSPTPVANPAIPTLDDLERLMPEERRVFRGVDWDFYERLLDLVGERAGIRIAF